jgi:UDP-N-acetyl-D-mannosaminuronic acid transferase (WecB/TagA/CpsF family)
MSGTVPRAPLWVRKLRLEWVFRLLIEPGRMWRRYILGNPVFLWRVARQKILRRPEPAGEPR